MCLPHAPVSSSPRMQPTSTVNPCPPLLSSPLLTPPLLSSRSALVSLLSCPPRPPPPPPPTPPAPLTPRPAPLTPLSRPALVSLPPCPLPSQPALVSSPESDEAYLFGLRKPKRVRTAFSPDQLLQLEQAFELNHYVVGQERKDLASELDLSETQVNTRLNIAGKHGGKREGKH